MNQKKIREEKFMSFWILKTIFYTTKSFFSKTFGIQLKRILWGNEEEIL